MKKIALIGGTKAFRRFLSLISENVVETSVENAVSDPAFDGMIFLPDYERGADYIEELSIDLLEVLAKRKTEGFRVYIENYYGNNCYNSSIFGYETLGGICHTQNESLLAQNGLQHYLGGARILQAANKKYLPALSRLHHNHGLVVNKVLLTLGRYAGTSQVVNTNVEHAYPMLIRTNGIISSLFSLTDFDKANMRPNCRFKKLFSYIFSFILGVDGDKVESAFEKTFPPLKTRFALHDVLGENKKRALYEQALSDAVQWHFDSGIVYGEHGEQGSCEMIMSNNGQKLYRNRRVDAGFYTGWLLYAAGEYFHNEDWKLTGKNIFYYYLEHAQLKEGIVEGMFDWYYNKFSPPNEVYSIDLGRDGIALCNMYTLLGDPKILEAIKKLAEGVMAWIADDRLLRVHIPYGAEGTEKHSAGSSETPAVYGELSSFMAMASTLLDDKKYVKKMKKVCDMLQKYYPNYIYYGHTTSSRMARLLLTLLPVQIAGEGDYSELINEQIDYFGSISMPCGGIYSEDNLSYERNSAHNSECGITTPWDADKISDQLYCVNNILAALSLLKKVDPNGKVNVEKGERIFHALLDYVVKIQIVDDDKRFMGGWMRSYSMTQEEYYGLDADILWGSYCIMAGWTMGMIPLAILYELQNDCPYVKK